MNKRQFYRLLAACAGGGLVLVLALVWLDGAGPVWAGSNVHCVNTTGTGCGGDCGGGCYSSVQAAVDAASTGHEVRIADGTHYGPAGGTVAVFRDKELTIRGGYDPSCGFVAPDLYRTTLDAQWGGSVISMTNAGDTLLELLTLTHGDATGNCGLGGCGGGIYAHGSSLFVSLCTIIDNVACTAGSGDEGFGGGIYIKNGGGDVWGSQIISNVASTNSDAAGTGYGGGISVVMSHDGVTLQENHVLDNLGSIHRTGYGAGIHLWSSTGIDVLTNTIRDNTGSFAAYEEGSGPGVYAIYSTVNIFGNKIEDNATNTHADSQSWGGGVMIVRSDAHLARNTIAGNSTGNMVSTYRRGGGVAIYGGKPVTLTNNLIARNDADDASGGGGIYVDWESTPPAPILLVNNTIADNGAHGSTGGIRLDDHVALVMTNTIVAGHPVGIIQTSPTSNTITADTNLFWNGEDPFTGTNGIRQDPLLLSSYRLGDGSPALDQGLNVPWLTTDLDGAPRPWDAYDIGAYEGIRWEVFLPLVLRGY